MFFWAIMASVAFKFVHGTKPPAITYKIEKSDYYCDQKDIYVASKHCCVCELHANQAIIKNGEIFAFCNKHFKEQMPDKDQSKRSVFKVCPSCQLSGNRPSER